jgi:hypothetical protein
MISISAKLAKYLNKNCRKSFSANGGLSEGRSASRKSIFLSKTLLYKRMLAVRGLIVGDVVSYIEKQKQ